MAAAAPPAKKARTGASVDCKAVFRYQVEVEGKRVGRYIHCEDDGQLADKLEEQDVDVLNAREMKPEPTLDTHCWEVRNNPTAVKNFRDDEEIKAVYYKEMEELVKQATGAERVILFDHTVRNTGAAVGLNAKPGEEAAAVQRVHTDYSDVSGPRRVKTLASSGGYTGVKLSEAEKEDILSRDFSIVNVWRNIKDEPVQQKPLALLNPHSLERKDFVNYEMRFPDRTGENYGLKYNPAQEWYYYPRIEKDECIIFMTWGSREDRPRYCFHTAFDFHEQPADAPPRCSIEVRTVAIMPKKEAK